MARLRKRSMIPAGALGALLLVLLAVLSGGMTCRGGSGPAVPVGPPAWISQSVGYEIFVRSFKDSDGDGIGDLQGIRSMLPYLNDGQDGGDDLGVNLIWLTPIHPSPSYHGYDVTDYRGVNPEFGTQDDLKALLNDAHTRGMRVILDLVANHTSREHPWFIASSAGANDPKRDWYLWRQDDPGWKQPWTPAGPVWHPLGGFYYYGIFDSSMPDLNYRNDAVLQEMEAVCAYWLGLGLDGFRVDAARHLVEDPDGSLADTAGTHQVSKEIKLAVRRSKPEAVLVAEAWTDTARVAAYAGKNDEYDLAFGFDLAAAARTSLASGNPDAIEAVLGQVEQLYPRRGFDAPILTNHDMDRLKTELGVSAQGSAPLRVGMALLLTLPGTPFLYYGEEIGMSNSTLCQGDICRRGPMAWTSGPGVGFTPGKPWAAPADDSDQVNVAAQQGDPGSLLSLVRNLIHMRQSNPALSSSQRRRLAASEPGVYATLRGPGLHPILVVLNFAKVPVTGATVDLSQVGEAGTELSGTELFSGQGLSFPADRSQSVLPDLPLGGIQIIAF